MRTLLRRLQFFARRRRLERELAEEMELHRTLAQQQLEREGLPPAAARAASLRAMGNITLAREDARNAWGFAALESVWQDARYAMRILRRTPAFSGALILITALGIGATTTVFTLVDSLVLRSLPVARPERLVYFDSPSFSYPIYSEVRQRGAEVFSGLFAWSLESANIAWTGEVEPAEVLTASGDFYSTLGIGAVVGRTFTSRDDQIGGGDSGRVAVLSHGAWLRRFGGDPSAIGRTLVIDRQPFTIIGVTPPGFFGVVAGLAPEVTVPLLNTVTDPSQLIATTSSWVHMMGRLRDGLSLQQADVAVQTFWPAVLQATTNANAPAERRALYLSRRTAAVPGRAGFSRVRNQFQEPLWILMALVTLLLLVACASAANLLLARGTARTRELAVRLALGAKRARIVRQMMTEALLSTTVGALAGLALASAGGSALVRMMATREEPIVLDLTLNWRILAFTIALAVVTSLVCALVPALRATRGGHEPALRIGREIGSAGLRGWSLGKALAVAQVALTILLLAGAGLFVRSLSRILMQDAGIERERILVVETDPVAAGYEGARLVAYYDRLLERIRSLSGVQAASLSWYPPISDDQGHWTQSIGLDGAPAPKDLTSTVYFNAVYPAYFGTVGMRLLQGRDFADADGASAPGVAIVNASLARKFFPGGNAVGHRITVGRNKSRRDLEIVGVVSDAKYQRLQEAPRAIAYLPCRQLAEFAAGENLFAEIRTAGPVREAADRVRHEVRAVDAAVPVYLETVTDRIRVSLVKERVLATLAVALGIAALALACAGLYGLLAYAVSRQTSEFGLRMALGAGRGQVLRAVLRECLTLAGAGALAGLGAAMALGRFARGMLFQISPADPIALAAAVLVMLAVAICAGLLPARRAASVDPVVALRHE